VKTVLLGRSGLPVGRIALGTMNFGGRCDETTARAILNTAVERGITMIDTANVYGHEPTDFEQGRGRSEEIIGRWLRDFSRDELVIATKMFFPMRSGDGAMGSMRRNIVRECEASLRRLGVETIDLYQLHHPSNFVPIDETLAALDDLIRAGKVHHVGSSSFAAWQIVEALWVSDARKLVRPVSEQPVYNLLDRRIERELAPMATTYDIALLTWSPLAGGALSDVYQRDAVAPGGSRYKTLWAGRDQALTPSVFDVIDAIRRLARDHGLDIASFATAWVLQRPEPTCVLIGPRTVEHLNTALAAADASLDQGAIEEVDLIVPPGAVVLPQYGPDGFTWHSWGPHHHRWR